jgi:hypothetical protein
MHFPILPRELHHPLVRLHHLSHLNHRLNRAPAPKLRWTRRQRQPPLRRRGRRMKLCALAHDEHRHPTLPRASGESGIDSLTVCAGQDESWVSVSEWPARLVDG